MSSRKSLLGITGTSGSGKTTLVEQLIARFVHDGRRVAAIITRITALISIRPARIRTACAKPAVPKSCS